jgi:hypothetical protein
MMGLDAQPFCTEDDLVRKTILIVQRLGVPVFGIIVFWRLVGQIQTNRFSRAANNECSAQGCC